jgi:hypothetical protein
MRLGFVGLTRVSLLLLVFDERNWAFITQLCIGVLVKCVNISDFENTDVAFDLLITVNLRSNTWNEINLIH